VLEMGDTKSIGVKNEQVKDGQRMRRSKTTMQNVVTEREKDGLVLFVPRPLRNNTPKKVRACYNSLG